MILVLGATGILGSKLLGELGPERAIAAARRLEGVDRTFKSVALNEAGVAADFDWSGITAVINAAGMTSGTDRELRNVNVDMPVSVATQARAHGVRRFVQVSSFSVFGDAETIAKETPQQPSSAYGRSKALAEERLIGLATLTFEPMIIRLPFMFSVQYPSLLSPLINVVRKLHVIPIGVQDAPRSMVTYGSAARILLAAAEGRIAQSGCAAELQNFHFELLAEILRTECNWRVRTFRVPWVVDKLLSHAAPTLHRRILRPSVLQPEANLARSMNELDGLENELRRLVRTMNRLD